MAMTKRLWSISALAVELDVDRRTISNALKRIPADGEQAGHPAWFLITAVRAIWPSSVASGEILDPAQERARKDRALAIQTELRNATATGELVPVNDILELVTREYSIVRTHFLALPSKVAARVPREVQVQVENTTRDLLYEAMDDFSSEEAIEQAMQQKRKATRR